MAGLSQENKLRDVFNPTGIKIFAGKIKKVWNDFNDKEFVKEIVHDLEKLGFIERSNLISEKLQKFLPENFPKAVKILLNALDLELEVDTPIPFENFIIMPQCAWVSRNGLKHFDLSMKALSELTKRFSAEGDLRTFLELDYKRCMETLEKWCLDPSPHVRRLVSEGTRPRLPLAGRIRRFQENPRPLLKLLDKLKEDDSLYVRRSVANNLNDIGKDNPDLVIQVLKKWRKLSNPKTDWIIGHASRSLIKNGNKQVLDLLGYNSELAIQNPKLEVKNPVVKVGEHLYFDLILKSSATSTQKIIVDYLLHYQKANGLQKPKVFKLRKITLNPKQEIVISAKHPMKQISTRKLYEGKHKIQMQINGQRYQEEEFILIL